MTRLAARISVWIFLGTCLRWTAPAADASGPLPDFNDVYETVRAHLAGASQAELNRAAIEGFIKELSPRVVLESDSRTNPPSGPSLSQSRVFEGDVAYLRLTHLREDTAKSIGGAYNQLSATNKLKGVVLDLRYTGGHDYPAVAAVADLFMSKEKPLLDWGKGVVNSKVHADAIKLPVAVLVNARTRAAAEALAAVLRVTGAGLILGSHTAGEAMIAGEFPLKDGQVLRIATAPIALGDGTRLGKDGVKPDIAVEVNPDDEVAYYADPFRSRTLSSDLPAANLSVTNQTLATTRTNRRSRFNEAELVRERREGVLNDGEVAATGSREAQPDQPMVQDPVLGRAIDLLKGLAVVRASR